MPSDLMAWKLIIIFITKLKIELCGRSCKYSSADNHFEACVTGS